MSLKERLDPILEKWTKEGNLPMISAGVVTKDGIIYLGASGSNNLNNPEGKTNLDTIFELYSTTKAVTTTAAVQLIEKGLLGLDDLVENYIPEIKGIKILDGFDENDKCIFKDPVNKPTIRNLLTHTAGFSYTFFSFKYAKLYDTTGKPDPFKDSWDEILTPYIYEPGTKWHYGVNIDVLGQVIQKVSGVTLDEYFKKNIFAPLGITSMTFIRKPEQVANKAIIHSREENGSLKVLPDDRPLEPEFHCGGHGLYGTIPDYLRFLLIFLNKGTSPITGKQILKPESVENYSFANLLPEGVFVEDSLEHSQPYYSKPVTTFSQLPKELHTWTSSFYRTDVPLPTGRSAKSFMWCGLPNLYYWIDPTEGVAGMLATQVFPFFDEKCLEANNEFESEVYKFLRA
ncbi:uncharacterized protein KQ657_001188 [Scheffersomyces spartinae]|uniref:Beta-lactamase-related domain-containing protein n=1 Tax=Scheffersomyces spartinae TaxID=45513 RepID=A0A9P7V809_9ASCO|nr:uncharacterized protein KQ657_001188 [Scheffersomyces spartinae]KAG7193071.1 hypothetical protein KQ657_001188 [Scheffersomyces spartinae]